MSHAVSAFAPMVNEFVPWAPWNAQVGQSKVALVTTGGVYLKHGMHQPFAPEGEPAFREFPAVVVVEDLDLGPVQYGADFAREDLNVVFPLERLRELADGGYIGGVAPFAYSFSDQTAQWPELLANYAPSVAYRIKRMGADLALVVAVGEQGHQTAGLVARAVELAGVSTLVLGTRRDLLEAVKVPRGAVVKHPAGSPLGNPGNAGKHEYLLREALETTWEYEGPGLIAELPFEWHG